MQSFDMVSKRLLLRSAAIMALIVPPMATRAQDAGTPGHTGREAASDIAEIVVTANKREQSLNDVGLTVTALSGDTLKSQHVSTLEDLARVVPSLTFQPTAYATPVYTLRGVGFYDSSLASYPTVSVYLDEAPQPLPVLTSHSAYDLERVEVLKGPQGTLFGNNSTGGAINFIAAKPTNEFETGGDLTYGRFSRVEGNAYVNGPLSENLKGRIAVNGARSDDWQRAVSQPGGNGQTTYIASRLLLDWQASDTLRFQFNANGWVDNSDPQSPQFNALIPQFPATVSPRLTSRPFTLNNARATDYSLASKPRSHQEMGQVTLRADFEIVPDVTVTSLTSYSGYNKNAALELDGTPVADTDIPEITGRINSFSQELRIANEGSAKFRWVIGGNYERTNVNEFDQINFSEGSLAPVFNFTGDRVRTAQQLRNYAGFANGEFDVSKQITLKSGVRFTQANRNFSNCTFDNGDGTFAGVFQGLANAIQFGFVPVPGFTPTGVPIAPLTTTSCVGLDNVTFDGTPATYLPGELHAKLNQNNVSWRVGVDFKPSEDILIYANVAKGYKSGSFPFLSGASFEQNSAVTQEALLDYEAGFKISAADRRLQFNGATFLYKYDNKQLRAKVPDPIFGLLDALVNVPKSDLKGVELEVQYRPVRGLNLSVAGSYIDSKIKAFTNYSASNTLTNFSGSPIPYTPKYQLNAAIDYRWDVGQVRPFIGANLSYRSDQFSNIGGSRGVVPPLNFRSDRPLSDIFTINGYALLDLRAGIESADSTWSVSIFGKNVTNTLYATNIQTSYDTVHRYTGLPTTYGITVGIKLE